MRRPLLVAMIALATAGQASAKVAAAAVSVVILEPARLPTVAATARDIDSGDGPRFKQVSPAPRDDADARRNRRTWPIVIEFE
jgi:hypothetical protein